MWRKQNEINGLARIAAHEKTRLRNKNADDETDDQTLRLSLEKQAFLV